MRLSLLTTSSRNDLAALNSFLSKFQAEVYTESLFEIDIEQFIASQWAIYFVKEGDEYVGFTSFCYNTYCGLREPTIGNSFIYIERKFRRSRAMHLISIQAGKICEDVGVPLEHYIADGSGSEKFVGRLNAKKVYTVYEISLEEVKRETARLMSKVKIKD